MDSTQTVGSGNPQENLRGNKPLGRGLQDISYLFFSRKTNPSELVANSNETETRQPAILLKACEPANRNAFSTMLTDLDGGFEDGLRVVDKSLPCNPYGQIDLLALDRSNQLVIIDFEMAENDSLLLRGVSHFDWAIHNLFNIRRMYALETINVLAEPKLVLLAPQFSGVLRSVARHIESPRIDWIQYHVVGASGGLAILFERVTP